MNGDQFDRALAIGHECVAVDSAISHLIAGHRNRPDNAPKDDVFATELFRQLTRHREALRTELMGMN